MPEQRAAIFGGVEPERNADAHTMPGTDPEAAKEPGQGTPRLARRSALIPDIRNSLQSNQAAHPGLPWSALYWMH